MQTGCSTKTHGAEACHNFQLVFRSNRFHRHRRRWLSGCCIDRSHPWPAQFANDGGTMQIHYKRDVPECPMFRELRWFPTSSHPLTAAPNWVRRRDGIANRRQWERSPCRSPAERSAAIGPVSLPELAFATPVAPRQRRSSSGGKEWGNGSSRAEHNTGGVIFAWDFGSYPQRLLADPKLEAAIFMRC